MKKLGFGFALLAALAFGCGGSEDTSGEEHSSGGEHEHHEHGDHAEHHQHGEHHEHSEMSPAVQAFHDGIAHHWHGDRSAAAVCPDAANLQGLANTAADEQPEQADEARAAAQAVVDTCAAEGNEGFDAAFDHLHNVLHAMMGDSPEHQH